MVWSSGGSKWGLVFVVLLAFSAAAAIEDGMFLCFFHILGNLFFLLLLLIFPIIVGGGFIGGFPFCYAWWDLSAGVWKIFIKFVHQCA